MRVPRSIQGSAARQNRRQGGRLAALAVLVLAAAGFGVSAAAQTVHPQNVGAQLLLDDTESIEFAMKGAGPGGTVTLQPGRYRVSDLVVPAGIVLRGPRSAVITGNLVAKGPNTTIAGITFAGSTIEISESQSVTIGGCLFEGGMTSITFNGGASKALIINNDFKRVAGGVITGWGLDQSTISGNHFVDCGQCLDLNFNNDRSRGRNIVVERNIFAGTARMPLEVGPNGAYTENLIVRDNWAEDFKNRGPDPGTTDGTFVAYSVVPTHGVNTVITGNYASAGVHGRGGIGIELDGSGQIANNYIQDFNFGIVVYGNDFDVHDNALVNTTDASVLNYAKRRGRIASNDTSHPPAPTARPERRPWAP
jgi:hypothetical protein